MKKYAITILVVLLPTIVLQSQVQISLTFSAKFNATHRTIDSIYVENLTRGGDTMLFGSDTILVLDYGTGIHDPNGSGNKEIFLSPAIPNPFSKSTSVSIHLAGNEQVTLKAFDLLGREAATFARYLQAGTHNFVFNAGKESWYVLVAETRTQRSVLKLINLGGQAESCRFEYNGWQNTGHSVFKTAKGGFSWVPGDSLRYVGFAMIDAVTRGHEIITDAPLVSQAYTFPLMEGIPCMDDMFITDLNGNTYRTVKIGMQCWLRGNLAASSLNDGTPLTNITYNSIWTGFSAPAYAWYMNDLSFYGATYGALYNWNAVATGMLCPSGWHVPSHAEWMILTNQYGEEGIAGGPMKESGHAHWYLPNTGATNLHGFTALPGGFRRGMYGTFSSIGQSGNWWSSSDLSGTDAWIRSIHYQANEIQRKTDLKSSGFSVRCLRNDTAVIPLLPKASFLENKTHITVNNAILFTDTSFGIPTAWKWYFGDGDSSSLRHPGHVYTNPGIYTVTLIVYNACGSDTLTKHNLITVDPTFYVYDVDSNPYDTIHIGNQVWLKQNLKTTRYNNGVTYIPHVQGQTQWESLNTGARCYYNNDSASYAATYGALYNFYAVDTVMLCPTGWHVPSQAEWDTLISYLGGNLSAGGPLKDTGFTFWNSPNTGATNQSGFSALASGYRAYATTQTFYGLGFWSCFWTSTEVWGEPAYYIELSFNNTQANLNWYSKRQGMSVRCLQN